MMFLFPYIQCSFVTSKTPCSENSAANPNKGSKGYSGHMPRLMQFRVHHFPSPGLRSLSQLYSVCCFSSSILGFTLWEKRALDLQVKAFIAHPEAGGFNDPAHDVQLRAVSRRVNHDEL